MICLIVANNKNAVPLQTAILDFLVEIELNRMLVVNIKFDKKSLDSFFAVLIENKKLADKFSYIISCCFKHIMYSGKYAN